MSNISRVIDFIKSEPNYNKDALVEKIIKELGVTKSNAQVYIYNANKKINSGAPVKAKAAKVKSVVAPKVVDKEVKAKNLEKLREVSASRKKLDGAKIRAELASFEKEVDEYANSSDFPEMFKKELGISSSHVAARVAAE